MHQTIIQQITGDSPQQRAIPKRTTHWLTAGIAQIEAFEAKHLHPKLDQVYARGAGILQQCNPWPDRVKVNRQSRLVHVIGKPVTAHTAEEQSANRALVYAAGILAFNTAGLLLYPPVLYLSGPFLLRIGLPFLEKALREWREQRKIGTSALDVAITIGMVAAGAFWTNALFHVLFAASHKIQLKTRAQMQQSLVNILGETPRTVWIEVQGVEILVPIEQVQIGAILIAHAGEILAVDGVIVTGTATIDQHSLTGEAQPVEKSIDDVVYAGTLLLAGTIRVRVEKSGVATVAGQVGRILRETADYHAGLELRGQRIADQSVIPSLLISGITLGALGVAAATAALTCSFGYQMRFTGPLSVLNFLNLAAADGILIKDGRALEQLTQIDMVVFDKTGTLTQEVPTLVQIHPLLGYTEDDVLRLAAAAEVKQQHPVARAILNAAQTRSVMLPSSDEKAYAVGYGLRVRIEQKVVQVGSARFMHQAGIVLPERIQHLQTRAHAEGYTLVYVAQEGALMGVLELHTTIRPEAKAVIHRLQQRGLAVAILSGDHEAPTRQLAATLGINQYFAETLPGDKAKVIAQLQAQGKRICFVGDGINDALALKTANTSVSLRGATTIALDTAQIILRDAKLDALVELFALADDFQANMRVNFLASTIPGLFSLAGVYLLNFGIFTAGCFAWSGLALGMTNAMLPLLLHRKPELASDSSRKG